MHKGRDMGICSNVQVHDTVWGTWGTGEQLESY